MAQRPRRPESGAGTPAHHARAVIGGRVFEYRLQRSARRRSMALNIDEDGLRVLAPWAAPGAAIERLLAAHAGWIERKLAEWTVRRAPAPEFAPGATFFVRGERVALACGGDAPRLEPGRLTLALAAAAGPADVRDALTGWLRAAALADATAWAQRFAPQLGVNVPSVGLSAARSRWGSCSAQGRILVNWRLVQAPPAFAEYVVAHEVAHLVHMNHSAAFWRTVGALVPDWRERRVRLRREAHRFLLL
jgi:predicted metal-dependent hydrolase